LTDKTGAGTQACYEKQTIRHLLTSTAGFEKWLQCRITHGRAGLLATWCNNRCYAAKNTDFARADALYWTEADTPSEPLMFSENGDLEDTATNKGRKTKPSLGNVLPGIV